VFGPPVYSDGLKRENIYYNAVKEHLNNPEIKGWAPVARFSNSQCGSKDYTWMDVSGTGNWLERIAGSGIAIYNVGGWFDLFSRATAQWYCSLRSTNPSRMLFLPLTHGSLDLFPVPMVGPYLRYFKEDPETLTRLIAEQRLRFFDRYLKGIRNGLDEEPPVLIYVMNGEGLRAEKEWPLKRQVSTRYYLHAGRVLNVGKPGEGEDEYQADLTHNARQGSNGDSRWSGIWMGEDIIRRTEKHNHCVTFTSPPLDCDTEATGHPTISLWMASTGKDGDFFVYLEDIDKGGEALYVTEGTVRAGFCHMALPASPDGPIVLPNLPYHSFLESDYVADVFKEGRKVEVLIDLYPTSWVFRKGHRIAVSIACADWPSYDLNPQLSPRNNPADPGTTIPRITLYHNSECPSYIELPIIPRAEVT
jgi:putative CocE/NonD family hydrolase